MTPAVTCGGETGRATRAAHVTHHAALRWLQRIDAREPRPAERVREALARAVPARVEVDRGEALRDPETGAVLVRDPDDGVRTVLLDGAGREVRR